MAAFNAALSPVLNDNSLAQAALWRSLISFCIYRSVIALILAITYWGFRRFQVMDAISPLMAMSVIAAYFVASLGLLGAAKMRFPFSPHLTISYYRTLDRAAEKRLLALRLAPPILIDRLELSRTNDPQPPQTVLTVMLGGGAT